MNVLTKILEGMKRWLISIVRNSPEEIAYNERRLENEARKRGGGCADGH